MTKSVLTLSLVIFALSGCVSMQSVTDYATAVNATADSVKPVASDFFDSCLRSNSYKPYIKKTDCSSEKDASIAILMVAGVLKAYGEALSALASDQLVSYEEDIDALTSEVNKLENFDTDQVEALSSLAKFITSAVTSGYQQRHVTNFIKETNDPVMNVSEGLADVLESNYAKAIKLELFAWETGYRNVEKSSRLAQPLKWEEYSAKQWQIRQHLEHKLTTVKQLSKSIRSIGETHKKLKADAEELDSKELVAAVRGYISTAKPVIQQINNAFSNR